MGAHDFAPGSCWGTSDRRIAKTRDGKPVWIRPRRGVRGGAPAAHRPLYSASLTRHNRADGHAVAAVFTALAALGPLRPGLAPNAAEGDLLERHALAWQAVAFGNLRADR